MVKTLTINLVEEYVVSYKRESITIDLNDYPQLRNKSKKFIVQFIKNNAENMISKDKWSSDLLSELQSKDVLSTKSKFINQIINVQ
jgi:hypothetical protein